MKLEHMTGPEHPLYAAAWALYEAAFPANERRDAEWQARALAQDAYHMCAAAEDGALCAIAFYWMHGGELFLEHLAVASELRGRGIGYEPVWSIGPGKTPAGKEYITKIARFVKDATGGMDIVYGGGLKTDNAEMLA